MKHGKQHMDLPIGIGNGLHLELYKSRKDIFMGTKGGTVPEENGNFCTVFSNQWMPARTCHIQRGLPEVKRTFW